MQLIKEIEVAYFRSFYKFKLRRLSDLNIIFGKNDSGKSNVVRALSLFFSDEVGHEQAYDFDLDFCDHRLQESERAKDVRKFLYVKITFGTPQTFQKSLGESFYVKRQWTVTRGGDYTETTNVPHAKSHILKRFLNGIGFIYIPAIKSNATFGMLLSRVHKVLAENADFKKSMDGFSTELQKLTGNMFKTIPADVSKETKIGAPTQMDQLFQTLDFETLSSGDTELKSLTLQRGDGIKARHIPELLSYISKHDNYKFHIWGFEEPENSLDFAAAQSESKRLLALAKGDNVKDDDSKGSSHSSHRRTCKGDNIKDDDSKGDNVQVFVTTHSPSFYLLKDDRLARYYVRKDGKGLSEPVQGHELESFDADEAFNEGFYLPAAAEKIKGLGAKVAKMGQVVSDARQLRNKLQEMTKPVLLTEGRTDVTILSEAWDKRREGNRPFHIRSCEAGGSYAGSGNGGVVTLATCLKGVLSDHHYPVIGLFDRDPASFKEYRLDRNFSKKKIGGHEVMGAIHGRSYAALLPVPSFRRHEVYESYLPIEFLFRNEALETEINGEKLIYKRGQAEKRVGDKKLRFKIPQSPSDDFYLNKITGGKTTFANNIVPSFPPEAFKAFDAVFELIEAIIESDQKDRKDQKD